MTNIWGFFIQTISVLIVAGMLLCWKYAVWSIFFTSSIIPVNVSRSIVPEIFLD